MNSYFPKEWSKIETTRNVILSHENIPDSVIKIYNSKPNIGHPMASILRVPMAHLIKKIIESENLDIEVATKGLIPLPGSQIESLDKYNLSELDENNINEAFLVVASKIKFLPDSVEKIQELGEDLQKKTRLPSLHDSP